MPLEVTFYELSPEADQDISDIFDSQKMSLGWIKL